MQNRSLALTQDFHVFQFVVLWVWCYVGWTNLGYKMLNTVILIVFSFLVSWCGRKSVYELIFMAVLALLCVIMFIMCCKSTDLKETNKQTRNTTTTTKKKTKLTMNQRLWCEQVTCEDIKMIPRQTMRPCQRGWRRKFLIQKANKSDKLLYQKLNQDKGRKAEQ